MDTRKVELQEYMLSKLKMETYPKVANIIANKLQGVNIEALTQSESFKFLTDEAKYNKLFWGEVSNTEEFKNPGGNSRLLVAEMKACFF